MLIRRDATLAVGGFDESSFLYYEEVDLRRRLGRADAATHHVPGAEIVHVGGVATVHSRSAMMIRRSRSTLVYDHRHLTGWRRWGWTTLVRTGWAAHLAYDTARLLVTQDPESCRRLREQQMVWWTAVCARPNRDGHPS